MSVRPILTTTTAVTTNLTTGGQGVQCGGLRLTRVRGGLQVGSRQQSEIPREKRAASPDRASIVETVPATPG